MRAGLQKVDVHRTHDEGEPRRFLFGRREQRAVISAEEAQIIGAPALHEAQIIGVVDDAGEVGVLVIDAHGKYVPPVADFAVEGNAYSSIISAALIATAPFP